MAAGAEYTGYGNVWVRDNVHIAHAHYVTGQTEIACRCVEALGRFLQKYSCRFEAVIQGQVDANDPMNRPHVRFNGQTLEENPEKWSQCSERCFGLFSLDLLQACFGRSPLASAG